MSVETLKYANAATITITLGSLASDAARLAGRESDKVDNSSNKYLDVLLSGKIKVGTSPANGSRIDIWAYGCHDETPTFQDVFDGTDSAETVTSEEVRNNVLVKVASIVIDSTSARTYYLRPTALAQKFGGVLPKFWGIFVTHDSTVALDAAGHEFKYTGITHELA